MKLLLTIVQDADANGLQRVLIENGFQSTKLASTGGFLREGNTTLLIGIEDHDVARAKEIIHATCRERVKAVTPSPSITDMQEGYLAMPMEVTVGGAVVFVLGVEEYAKL